MFTGESEGPGSPKSPVLHSLPRAPRPRFAAGPPPAQRRRTTEVNPPRSNRIGASQNAPRCRPRPARPVLGLRPRCAGRPPRPARPHSGTAACTRTRTRVAAAPGGGGLAAAARRWRRRHRSPAPRRPNVAARPSAARRTRSCSGPGPLCARPAGEQSGDAEVVDGRVPERRAAGQFSFGQPCHLQALRPAPADFPTSTRWLLCHATATLRAWPAENEPGRAEVIYCRRRLTTVI